MSLLIFPASIALAVWAFLLRKKPGIGTFVRAVPPIVLCLWLFTIVLLVAWFAITMGTMDAIATVSPADKAAILADKIAEFIHVVALSHIPIVVTLAAIFLFFRWRWADGSRR